MPHRSIAMLSLALNSILADMTLHSLANVDPLAMCTDGSPAVYYWTPATTEPHTWLVYLMGGGWCHDSESCEERCGLPGNISGSKYLCSSKALPPSLPASFSPDGIFEADGNDRLTGANKVYVHYCTSDGHMGNASSMGYEFRGHVVVQAVLTDLVGHKGLGSGSERDLLIFGGGSAGARGSMVHLDYVPEMLGSAAINVDLVGFLDSNYWVDVELYNNSSFIGFPRITQDIHTYANVQHLGESCADQYAKEDQWKCMFGEYRMPHVTTPHFMVASQYDSYQLGNLLGTDASSVEAEAYMEMFADRTRSSLRKLHQQKKDSAVFSWACLNHCVSTSHSGFDALSCSAPKTATMHAAFAEYLGWSNTTTSPRKQWIDTCQGTGCGDGCSASTLLV